MSTRRKYFHHGTTYWSLWLPFQAIYVHVRRVYTSPCMDPVLWFFPRKLSNNENGTSRHDTKTGWILKGQEISIDTNKCSI